MTICIILLKIKKLAHIHYIKLMLMQVYDQKYFLKKFMRLFFLYKKNQFIELH